MIDFDRSGSKKRMKKKRKTLIECSGQLRRRKKRKALTGCPEIGDDIIFQEILPRLPIKSLCRFKSVCKKWFNLLTHDPIFPKHHSQKYPIGTTNPTTFFSHHYLNGVFFFFDSQFKWSTPISLVRCPVDMVDMVDMVMGSANGLIYGDCSNSIRLFIYNPITKHTVYVPYPRYSLRFALLCDPFNPSLGFTIVSPVSIREHNDGFETLQFKVYSSKTGEWRVSKNASEFRAPGCRLSRDFFAVYTGENKVYWSLITHILWFDIEKDVAGLVRCPKHRNFVRPDLQLFFTEIGVCEGQLSFSRMTKEGDLEIWLLREKNNEFEWVKKHTVGLQRIVEENWDMMSRFYNSILKKRLNIKKGMKVGFKKLKKGMKVTKENAAEALTHFHCVEPLPYSGGEVLWFSFRNATRSFCYIFSFNIKTLELKFIGKIKPPYYQFVPTLLPCPT